MAKSREAKAKLISNALVDGVSISHWLTKTWYNFLLMQSKKNSKILFDSDEDISAPSTKESNFVENETKKIKVKFWLKLNYTLANPISG